MTFHIKIFCFCLLVLFLGACVSRSQTKSKVENPFLELSGQNYRPWVEGHRGARSVLPENTLPAFDYALSVGVDVLEMDLGVTADRVVVVGHDPILNPEICLDPKGQKIKKDVVIFQLTYEQLKSYDCGTLKNPKFFKQNPVPKTSMPRLKDVFDLVRNSPHPTAIKVRFNIETKIDPRRPELTVGPEEFAALVVKEFEESGFLDRIVLQSFDFRTLREAKKLNPKLKLSMLVNRRADNSFYFEEALSLGVQIFSPNYALLNAPLVQGFHSLGIQVLPWTLNHEEDWEQALLLKVDGIITDDPESLIQFLKERGLR